jgi:hypothetical protein
MTGFNNSEGAAGVGFFFSTAPTPSGQPSGGPAHSPNQMALKGEQDINKFLVHNQMMVGKYIKTFHDETKQQDQNNQKLLEELIQRMSALESAFEQRMSALEQRMSARESADSQILKELSNLPRVKKE